MKTVVIFGGSGFVGRNLIRRIAKKRYKIIVPYQKNINESELKLLGNLGQITPVKFLSIEDNLIKKIIRDSDIIFNLKTSWEESRKKSFEKNIYLFNKKLIKIINSKKNNKKYIFFSGIGVKEITNSSRMKSIFKVEEYIKSNVSDFAIIKPSIIIGGKDLFFGRLLPIFRISPLIPVFGKGNSKLQLVFIEDIILACEKIMEKNILNNEIYELTNDRVFTYNQLYELIADTIGIKRFFIPIPFTIASFAVALIQKTPINLLTKEQLLLFKKDNISTNKYKKLSDLDIKPTDIIQTIKNIIKKNY